MEYLVQAKEKCSDVLFDTIDCEKWVIENLQIGERATVLCFPYKNKPDLYVYGVIENNGVGKFSTWYSVEKG